MYRIHPNKCPGRLFNYSFVWIDPKNPFAFLAEQWCMIGCFQAYSQLYWTWYMYVSLNGYGYKIWLLSLWLYGSISDWLVPIVSGIAIGGSRGCRVPPLRAKNLPIIRKREKIRKNWEKEEISGRKGKNREGSFTLPLPTDRAGYATANSNPFS